MDLKKHIDQICERYAKQATQEETILFQLYSCLQESLSIGLSNSGNQEEARSRLRQFGSGLNNNKDLLSRYDIEKLNEEMKAVEGVMAKHFMSKRPAFGMTRTKPQATKLKVLPTPTQTAETKINYTLNEIEGDNIVLKSEDDVIHLHAIRSSVVFIDKPKKSVHLSDIESSVVFICHVDGSVLAHRITNSIVMVSCTQFRVHDSENCLLSLNIPNHPVIEHCNNLTFSNLTQDVSDILDIDTMKWDEMKNQYDQVRDFNWFQTTPSPHWGVDTMQSYVDIHEDARLLMKRMRILTERKCCDE